MEWISIISVPLIVIIACITLIRDYFQRKRLQKNNSICPKCGAKLVQELSSQEKGHNEYSGRIYVEQVVEYYYILYCNECGYSVTMDELKNKQNTAKNKNTENDSENTGNDTGLDV